MRSWLVGRRVVFFPAPVTSDEPSIRLRYRHGRWWIHRGDVHTAFGMAMKQSELRADLEKVAAFNQRGRGKLARKPLKARAPVKRSIDRMASEAWAKGVRGKPCAVCGAKQRVSGHHIVTQQLLRRIAQQTDLDFERVRWDARNRLPLCERHHEAHHSRARPVALWRVLLAAPKLMQFVRELDRALDGEPVAAFIDRTYRNEPGPLRRGRDGSGPGGDAVMRSADEY